ncbi:hypothetical protein MJ546_33690, partial [Burkholderia gladioli]
MAGRKPRGIPRTPGKRRRRRTPPEVAAVPDHIGARETKFDRNEIPNGDLLPVRRDGETDREYGARLVGYLEQQCEVHRNLETAAFEAIRSLEDAQGGVVERRMFLATIGLAEYAASDTGRGKWSRLRTYGRHREPIDRLVAPRFITHGGTIMQGLSKKGGMKAIRGETPSEVDGLEGFSFEEVDEAGYERLIGAAFSPAEGRRHYEKLLMKLRQVAEQLTRDEGFADPLHVEGFAQSLLGAASVALAEDGNKRRAFDAGFDPDPDSEF